MKCVEYSNLFYFNNKLFAYVKIYTRLRFWKN